MGVDVAGVKLQNLLQGGDARRQIAPLQPGQAQVKPGQDIVRLAHQDAAIARLRLAQSALLMQRQGLAQERAWRDRGVQCHVAVKNGIARIRQLARDS